MFLEVTRSKNTVEAQSISMRNKDEQLNSFSLHIKVRQSAS